MMSEETRRVLDLLSQGKVTVEEADQLLRALGANAQGDAAASSPSAEAERPKPRFIRINVHKAANDRRGPEDVNIRVPIAIVRSGMRLGALIPGLAGEQVVARCARRVSTSTSRSSMRPRSRPF